MTFNKQNQKNNSFGSERGVTLLLALLIMAAISTIVFAAASVAVNEIRTSADVTKSEPSITGAQAVAEDYLYAGVRGTGTLASCSNPATSSYAGGVTVSACASLYQDNPYSFNLTAKDTKYFYLYDPNNPGNGGGYTSVRITMTDGDSALVYMCDYTVADCVAGPHISSASLNVSVGATTWNSPALDPNTRYQILVVNGNANGNFYTQSSPQGLPAGITSIETTGSSQGVTRKLRTELPQ